MGGATSGRASATSIRRDRWDDLGGVLSDEVLDTLVPSGTFDELPAVLPARFDGLGQGIVVTVPANKADDDSFAGVVAALRSA